MIHKRPSASCESDYSPFKRAWIFLNSGFHEKSSCVETHHFHKKMVSEEYLMMSQSSISELDTCRDCGDCS